MTLIFIWFSFIIFFFYKKSYVAVLFNILVGIYELCGTFLLYLNFSWLDIPEQRRFIDMVDYYSSNKFLSIILLFIITFNVTNILTQRKVRHFIRIKGIAKKHKWDEKKYNRVAKYDLLTISAFVFITGIAAFYTDAGYVRLQDYLGEEHRSSRLFSYGTAIFVALSIYMTMYCFLKKGRKIVIPLILSLPMIYEMYLTGRRQLFAPTVIIVIVFTLYKKIKNKLLLSISIIFFTLIFLGMQYSLREKITMGSRSIQRSFVKTAIIPQLGEFVAVGSISFRAINSLKNEDITNGFHFIVNIMNSFPFIKFGNRMMPIYVEKYWNVVRSIAPQGGFTMIAEAYMALATIGVFFLALILGLIINIFDELINTISKAKYVSLKNVYWTSIIGLIIMKYRSGISDAILIFINFTIIIFFLHIISTVIMKLNLEKAK